MDISMFPGGKNVFGEEPVNLILKYKDIAERQFEDTLVIDPSKCLGPMSIGEDILKEIKKVMEKLLKNIEILSRNIQNK